MAVREENKQIIKKYSEEGEGRKTADKGRSENRGGRQGEEAISYKEGQTMRRQFSH